MSYGPASPTDRSLDPSLRRRLRRWLPVASLGMMLTCGTGTGTGNAAAPGPAGLALQEPGTLLLFGAGLLGLAFVARRFSRG